MLCGGSSFRLDLYICVRERKRNRNRRHCVYVLGASQERPGKNDFTLGYNQTDRRHHVRMVSSAVLSLTIKPSAQCQSVLRTLFNDHRHLIIPVLIHWPQRGFHWVRYLSQEPGMMRRRESDCRRVQMKSSKRAKDGKIPPEELQLQKVL